jgi:hypothetical protein
LNPSNPTDSFALILAILEQAETEP